MTKIPIVEGYEFPHQSQLPAPIPTWEIDARRAILLVHDMQSYFLEPLRPSGLATVLIGNIAALIAWCRPRGIPIAYTAQPGGMSKVQRGLLHDFWGEGMAPVEEQRRIAAEVAPEDADWRHVKWRYSAFFNSDLHERMADRGREQIVLCGVYAGIGIVSTAIEAYSRDIETFVVADAVADLTRESHWQAIEYAAKCCAVVLSTEQVIR